MSLVLNWASICRNHTVGSVGQNGGSLMLTAPTVGKGAGGAAATAAASPSAAPSVVDIVVIAEELVEEMMSC